jgi:hypothetical protein
VEADPGADHHPRSVLGAGAKRDKGAAPARR